MAHILAIAVGLGSFVLYMAAFFLPEVHRKYDFVWSGVAMFYALVLWVCDGRITGGVLLGQMASVALLGWLGWQTLQLRRQLTPAPQQTPLPQAPSRSIREVAQDALQNLKRLRRQPTPRPTTTPSAPGKTTSSRPGSTATRRAIAPPSPQADDSNDSLFDPSPDITPTPEGSPATHSTAPATTEPLAASAEAIAAPIPNESAPPADRRTVEEIPTARVLDEESHSPFDADPEDSLPPADQAGAVQNGSSAGTNGATNGTAPESTHPSDVPDPVDMPHATNGGLPRGAIASESLALRKPLVIRAEIIGFDEAPPSSRDEGETDEDWGHPPESPSHPPAGDDEEWF